MQMHTYIHIHTYIKTRPTYIHACKHADMHDCMYARTHACLYAYKACMHARMQACPHALFGSAFVPVVWTRTVAPTVVMPPWPDPNKTRRNAGQ